MPRLPIASQVSSSLLSGRHDLNLCEPRKGTQSGRGVAQFGSALPWGGRLSTSPSLCPSQIQCATSPTWVEMLQITLGFVTETVF